MKTLRILLVSIPLFFFMGFSIAQENQHDNTVYIRDVYGSIDHVIRTAAEQGVVISVPEGFYEPKRELPAVGNASAKLYTIDNEVCLSVSPVEVAKYLSEEISNFALWRYENECKKNFEFEVVPVRDDFSAKKVAKLFNAGKGYLVRRTQEEGQYIKYKYTTGLYLMKGDKLLATFGLSMTEKGRKYEKKYLKALYRSIRFE